MSDEHDDVETDMRREFAIIRKAIIDGQLPPADLGNALSALMDVQVRTLGLLPRIGDGKFLTIETWTPYRKTLIWVAGTLTILALNIIIAFLALK